MLRTVLFAPEDLALVKGDPVGAPPLPRRAAGGPGPALRRGPGRLRPGAQAAQRPAEVGPRRPARRAAEGALHDPRRLGRAPGAAGRRAAGRPAGPGRRARAAGRRGVRRGAERRPRADRAGRTPSSLRPEALAEAGPRREALGGRLLAAIAERRPAGARAGRHPRRAAPRRPRAARPGRRGAAGQGLRQPRRVLVVRARAAAGVRTTCCAPTAAIRCSCSTTSSPSWTPRRRERLAALVAPAEQVLVTAAVAQDVPGALAGVRVDVQGGQVQRAE